MLQVMRDDPESQWLEVNGLVGFSRFATSSYLGVIRPALNMPGLS